MTWLTFKDAVLTLLTVDRNRLGAEDFIQRQIRYAVGDIQRLISYYRQGMRTVYAPSDATVSVDGFASIITLPIGSHFREIYYVSQTNTKARRSLREYAFSTRHDLVAGVVNVGALGQWFRYAVDQRDGARSMWIYPAIVSGFQVEFIWDALLGRSVVAPNYPDSTEVPFDEPVQLLVAEWVKAKLAREVDRDLNLSRDYERTYRQGVASLYSEVEERLRMKAAESLADCLPTECPSEDDEGEVAMIECCFKEFETVNAMLAYPSLGYRFAKCYNYDTGDDVDSFWIRTNKPGLVDDGFNIRQTTDGSWLERIYHDP